MLKMGTYGLLRVCVPLFPNAAHRSAGWVNALAITGIVFGALVALVQPNMKKLVAYSSVSHLGFVVLGIFSFTQQGLDGAVYQMLAHGISTGALFMLVGYLYERRHSLEISAYGGVATAAPNLATVFHDHHACLASASRCSATSSANTWSCRAQRKPISTGSSSPPPARSSPPATCCGYTSASFSEKPRNRSPITIDLTGREWAAIIPLIALMFWLGILHPNLHARDHHAKRGHSGAGASNALCARLRLPRDAQASANEKPRCTPQKLDRGVRLPGALRLAQEAR